MWWCFFNPHLLDYINDNIFNIYLLLNFDYISEIYLLFLFIKIDLLYLLNFKIRSAQKRSLESSVPDQRLIFDESRQECKYTTKQSAYIGKLYSSPGAQGQQADLVLPSY